MFRRITKLAGATVVAVTLATGALSVGTAGRADAMNPPQTNAYYVVTLLGNVNQPSSIASYWTQMFRAWNKPFRVPAIVFYGDYYGNRATGCEHTSLKRNNAFYCSRDNTIYVDYEYAQDLMGPGGRFNYGDYGFGGLLAHEFSHAVQAALGWPLLTTFHSEYAADCLAGMYTRWAYGTGRLNGGDYWEFHNWQLGWWKSASHGDPTTRTQWYRYGYDWQNASYCGLAYQATA